MPLSISSAAIVEKNKLATTGVWLVLLEIAIDGGSTVYLVRNTEDVTWPSAGGNTYTAFPFELDEISDQRSGEVPSIVARVGNVSRYIQGLVEANDGLVGSTVTIRVVNSTNLSATTAELSQAFLVTGCVCDEQWVHFTLSIGNPMRQHFPGRRIKADRCQWKQFRGTECGYAGAETSCDRTLGKCREYGNQARFGGFPGVQKAGGVYFSV